MEVIREFRFHDDTINMRAVKAKSRTGHVYLIQDLGYDDWGALRWQTVSQSNDRDEAIFDLGYRVGVKVLASNLGVMED